MLIFMAIILAALVCLGCAEKTQQNKKSIRNRGQNSTAHGFLFL